MTKVSIIVPVYNTSQYLAKCLESLINQSLDEIEIIIVNDGSPDNCQEIIDFYVKNYPKKTVSVQKQNEGLSMARNDGIKIAKGEYIGFVDSDDWIDLNMLETMYTKAKTCDFDLIVCDVNFVYESYCQCVTSGLTTDVLTKQDVKQSMNNIFPGVWNKLYRRSLFENDVAFKKGVWFEDVEFIYRLLIYVESIGVVSQPLVFYLQRSNAITKTFNIKLFDYLTNWEGIISFYRQKNLFQEYHLELEYSFVRYILGTFLSNSLKLSSDDLFRRSVSEAFALVKREFPCYRLNRYFYINGCKGYQLLLMNPILMSIRRKYISHI